MDKRAIADILDDCGTLLELKGENPFRANAYHNAARTLTQLEGNLEQMLADGSLGKVKGLGETMIEKITEMVQTGRLAFHEKLVTETPPGLVDMLRISGFGPKRIKLVHEQLGIDTVEKLRTACEDGTVAKLKGFGQKSADKILEGIRFLDVAGKRVLLPIALTLAERMLATLRELPQVQKIEYCGSLRRGRETIKDLDILVASDDAEPIMKAFVEHPDVIQITGHGPTKSSVLLANGVPADLRVVTEDEFPYALLYFTGSKEHNVALRGRAQDMGLKLNEYDLAGGKKKLNAKSEADIYKALGLAYVPPELREDTGEIDAAEKDQLPTLLKLEDITGTFHCHTNASDGGATLEEMALATQERDYKYLGIADHSKTAIYANGLSPERVKEQFKAIDKLNAKMKGFKVFKGIESDILADGSLDYDDDLLAQFDYVVASIHSPLAMSSEEMTKRIIRAIRHPKCTMIGHLTGRLLLQRDSYPMDVEAILQEAARTGTMIEINANPHRLDLDWISCKRAKALGITLVINPDAHSTRGLDDIPFGVLTARRGWLEKKNVFNTLPLAQIEKKLKELAARK